MKFLPTLLLLFTFSLMTAQYTTPDTGVDWTLDDIANASATTVTVSGSVYTLHEDLTIAENDILRIDTDITLEIEAGVRVTVFGAFFVEADDVTITAVNDTAPYEGFRFEEFSDINIQNAIIEYGGGLQVLTETFTLNNCTLQYNVSGTATGAVVTMFRGVPVITNNTFTNNTNPALSSGVVANPDNGVSAYIYNNYIEANNQTNNNRPQINMGNTRATDTLKIINNTIIGDRSLDMVGGIAVANFSNIVTLVTVEGNTIKDNRYGVTILGACDYVLIANNIIEDNDTQGDPMDGGSGINCFSGAGAQNIVITENQIRRNLWGITIQQQTPGASNINLGDDDDNPGGNVFADNGNNGEIYALYNNFSNTIMAKHNCWVEDGEGTLAEAEDVIFHIEDDPSLGEVIFDPIFCETMNVADVNETTVVMYPNPTTDVIFFQNQNNFEVVVFYDLNGKKVLTHELTEGNNTLNFNLPAGMYFASFKNDQSNVVKKLVVR